MANIPENRSYNKNQADNLQAKVKLILREYAEALVIAVVLALIVRFFVLTAYRIPTASMIPTLKVGDFIFAYKLPFGVNLPWSDNEKIGGGLPQRGSVVVFRCPNNSEHKCVKRVIGLPGDRIQIKGKRLALNGQWASYRMAEKSAQPEVVILEEKIFADAHRVSIGRSRGKESFGPVVVPPGHFFVLGDYRDASEDSREWGMLPLRYIEGEALFVWLSLDWQKPLWQGRLPSIRWERVLSVID